MITGDTSDTGSVTTTEELKGASVGPTIMATLITLIGREVTQNFKSLSFQLQVKFWNYKIKKLLVKYGKIRIKVKSSQSCQFFFP